jgi:hypothetical protein
MAWNELADVLLALVESVQAPRDVGLVVTEADLDIPLEVASAMRDGTLVFYGSAPHTRWKSGILPPVHLGRLHVELFDEPQRD